MGHQIVKVDTDISSAILFKAIMIMPLVLNISNPPPTIAQKTISYKQYLMVVLLLIYELTAVSCQDMQPSSKQQFMSGSGGGCKEEREALTSTEVGQVGPTGRYALDDQIWRWRYHVVRAILRGGTKASLFAILQDVIGCIALDKKHRNHSIQLNLKHS